MQTYRAEHPEQPILYLDAGRAFPVKTQDSDVVVPHMIQAYEQLGLDAMNAGEADLEAGFSFYSSIANGAPFKTVSANLRSIDKGEAMLPPYAVVTPRTAAGGVPSPRVAVVGLTTPQRYRLIDGLGPQKLHFTDAAEAAALVLPDARAESDLLVVLGNFEAGVARKLAGLHPDIDLIIANDEREPLIIELEHNGVPIVMTGTQGKRLIRLDLFREDGPRRWRVASNITELDAEVRNDPDAARFMQVFQGELDERTRVRAESNKRDPRYPDYVGSAACASCHPEASAVWAGSRHAAAWEPLEKSGNTLNPLCLQCHTSGFLRPNGFFMQASQPHLVSVGCESCHGAGGAHVKDPFHAKLARSNEETCRTCHTMGQTPDFHFEEFWPKIAH
jgi:hypothetical protein